MVELEPLNILRRFCNQFPLKNCFRASGRISSERQGTANTVPRIFLPINAAVRINIPQKHKVASHKMQVGDALFIPPHIWNRTISGKSFLVLFFAQHHCRVFIWHRNNRNPSKSYLLDSVPPVSRLAIQAALVTEDLDILRDLLQVCMRDVLVNAEKTQEPIQESRQRWLEIIDWLDDHFHENIDRNEVATLFRMHPNHLSRLFRQEGNDSFNAYVIRKRIGYATHLLQNSDLPIAEIGARCGYPSPTAFSGIVKKMTGKAPSAWR